MKTVLVIKGTHCKSCKMLIEDVCSDYLEIKSYNMDLDTEKLTIEHDDSFDLDKLKEEIVSLGEYSFG